MKKPLQVQSYNSLQVLKDSYGKHLVILTLQEDTKLLPHHPILLSLTREETGLRLYSTFPQNESIHTNQH